MEKWLKKAKNAVEADASVAYAMCEDTALKEQVELDWVIEVFTKKFRQLVEEAQR